MEHTVYSRAVARAAEILGSSAALAAYLGVTRKQVALWTAGEALPPQHIFLKVVDVLAESNLTELREGNGASKPG